ncbi:MAG: GGDEF domain-containing protein [Gammaproteobacteria bacterium]|uniref:diguanylate cyclase n=1 Tax=Marinobacter nitratireducens TaxID=1137280 RepID=A0A072NIS9_9GAMM|nr:GGDEF domain-containing protein [Marinobacter nitratireducens]KEF33060.1 diguanylate cyclase [Marinobacter nitratireducens]TNE77486.1 MAG: GGDEF domain-containing protein [Gammaproteobacteria bacterium]
MSVFPSSDSLATTPTLAVLGFKRQLVYHLHFWAFIAVAPLVLVQWRQDHHLLAMFLILFCANAVLVIGCLRYRNTYFLRGRLFPLLAVISAVYSTAINGHAGLYWSYPAATALFFLLPLREAIGSNIVFVITMSAVSFMKFPEPDFWRITFSLGLTCLFAMIFAWLVGKLQEELTRLATTDPLTGCLNRTQLADILNSQIQMRERYERVSSLVLLDLDFFKAINDQWGHLAGDKVLKEMTTRIRKRLRESDQLFRIGGEEFMIVLPETREKDADTLAHQLLTSISSRPFLNDIKLTASASVAEVSQGETWSVWLNRADHALYEAKSRGRNQVVNAFRSRPMNDQGPLFDPAPG